MIRFAEFCDACKYKYIGVCYGLLGVGKTLSSKHYCNCDYVEQQFSYKRGKEFGANADQRILDSKTIFYTASAVRATKMTNNISSIGSKINMVKTMYKIDKLNHEEDFSFAWDEDIDFNHSG